MLKKAKVAFLLIMALVFAVQSMPVAEAEVINKLTAEYIFDSLGDALNYGTVAREWEQNAHAETSVCVDDWERFSDEVFANSDNTYFHAMAYDLEAEISASKSLQGMTFALYRETANGYERCEGTENTISDNTTSTVLTWRIGEELKNTRLYVFRTNGDGYIQEGSQVGLDMKLTYGPSVGASAQNENYIGKIIYHTKKGEGDTMGVFNTSDYSPTLVFGPETRAYYKKWNQELQKDEYFVIDPNNKNLIVDDSNGSVLVNYYYSDKADYDPAIDGDSNLQMGYMKLDGLSFVNGVFYRGGGNGQPGKIIHVRYVDEDSYADELVTNAEKFSKELGNMGGGELNSVVVNPDGGSSVTGPVDAEGHVVSIYDIEVGTTETQKDSKTGEECYVFTLDQSSKHPDASVDGIPVANNEYVIVNLICPSKDCAVMMTKVQYYHEGGKDDQVKWGSADSNSSQRVIYNFVYADENGVMQPFEGTIIPHNGHGGTLLAPKAFVHLTQNVHNGSIIADKVNNGQEIHQRTLAPLGRRTWVKMDGGYITLEKASLGYNWSVGAWQDMSAKTSLAGAVFGVYSSSSCSESSLVTTMTTNAQGVATSEMVAAGTYWVKEITPLKDHELNTDVVKVTVVAGQEPTKVQGGGYSDGYIWVGPGMYDYEENWIIEEDKFVNQQNEGVASLRLEKVDELGNVLPGAVFGIYDDYRCRTQDLVGTMKTNYNGVAVYEGLPLRFDYGFNGSKTPEPYYVKEISAPEGYEVSGHVATVRLTENDRNKMVTVDGNGNAAGNAFTNSIIRGNLALKKVDAYTGDGLAGAEFTIYSDSACTQQVGEVMITDANGVATSANVIAGKDGLIPGTYYVKETKAPNGYALPSPNNAYEVKVVSGKLVDIVTNTEIENMNDLVGIENEQVVSIVGTKSWPGVANVDGLKITIGLYKYVKDNNGNWNWQMVANVPVSKETDWTFTFEDLPRYEAGEEIDYEIRELNFDGSWRYQSYITETKDANGNLTISIVNSIKNTVVRGTKQWTHTLQEGDGRPDSIEFTLYQQVGEELVPVYDQNNALRTYRAQKGNNYSFEFRDLPTYDATGNVAKYVVKEEESDKYIVVQTEDGEAKSEGENIVNEVTLTNMLTVPLHGTKVWNDSSDAQDVRPDAVTLTVYRVKNGEATRMRPQPTIAWDKETNPDVWTWEVLNLPKYDGNDLLSYYVVEERIATRPGQTSYQAPVYSNTSSEETDKAYDGGTITNSLTGRIRLYKESDFETDRDGTRKRLGNVEFKVYADEECTQEVVLPGAPHLTSNSGNEIGKLTITNVPYGTYWLKEVKAPEGYAENNKAYKVVVNGDPSDVEGDARNEDYAENDPNAKWNVVLNSRLSTTGSIALTKTDADTGAKLSRAVFTVYSDEACTTAVGTMVEDTANRGVYIMDGLTVGQTYWVKETGAPTKTADGVEGTYQFDQDAKYSVVVTGNNTPVNNGVAITNKAITSVSVEKVWVDAANNAALPPASIEVQLYNTNGTEVESDDTPVGEVVTLSNEYNWSHTWPGLDKYDATGEEIVYRVDEVAVPDNYIKTVTTVDNVVTITNTYVAPIEVSLSAQKKLNGAAYTGEEFTFVLEGNKVRETVSSVNGGEVAFSKIAYTLADMKDEDGYATSKTFTYTISEEKGTAAGVIYDETVYTAEVTVTYNAENGTLTASPVKYYKADDATKADTAPEFINTYAAEGSVALAVKKSLVGGTFKAGDSVTFTLSAAEGQTGVVPMPSLNTVTLYPADGSAEGTVSFIAIPYTLADAGKSYTYIIQETACSLDNVINDTTQYEVTVTIADNKDGTLEITTDYGNNKTAVEVTNTYVAPIEVSLAAQKKLNGAAYTGEEFTFVLEGNNVRETVSSVNGGEVAFSKIAYTLADMKDEDGYATSKTFTYTISEEKGTAAGVIYDEIVYTAEVTVTCDVSTGTLGYSVAYKKDGTVITGDVPVFENATEKVDISVTKVWDDNDNEASKRPESIQVQLLNGTTVVDTVELPYNGAWSYTWPDLAKYDDTGAEIVYRVDEVAVPDNYIKTVTTVDNVVTITNTYVAPIEVSLSAQKKLNGSAYTGGEFTFVLEGNNVEETVSSVNGGEVAFSKIAYTLADMKDEDDYATSKTFTYTISEEKGTAAGVIYDDTIYTAEVTVTCDVSTGTLGYSVAYKKGDTAVAADDLVFANASAITAELPVEKTLTTNANVNDVVKAYSFTLTPTYDGATEQAQTITVTVDDATLTGTNVFSLNFAAPGTYTYTVAETVESQLPGYTYDDKVYTVTYVVDFVDGKLQVKNGAPQITLDGASAEKLAFENDYTQQAGSATLKANKVFTNGDLEATQFTFLLLAADGTTPITDANGEAITTTSNAKGEVVFPDLHYDVAGTYNYVIKEQIPENQGGIVYDGKAVNVTVTVAAEDGKLVPTVQYDGSDVVPTFTNTQLKTAVELGADKTFTNGELTDGQFTFQLVDEDGNAITATNDADGKVEFPALTFDTTGEFHYVIKEQIPENQGNIAYDNAEFPVTVTVTRVDDELAAEVTYANGEAKFTNTQLDATGAVYVKKNFAENKTAAGEFTFTMTPVDNAPALANNTLTLTFDGTNTDASGVFQLPTYTESGTYTYTVKESTASKALNIKYDTTEYPVVVTVTRVNDQLAITVTSDGVEITELAPIVFTNEVLTTSLSGTKVWVDDDATTRPAKITIHLLANGEPTGKYVELASTETEWSFTDLPVNDENGAITYAVSEDEVPGYVSEIVDTTITNTKIADGQAQLRATKELKNGTLTDGQFTFELLDEAGNAITDSEGNAITATNDASGNVAFPALTYNAEGEYKYIIKEKPGTDSNIVYDGKAVNVTVTVTENGSKLEAAVTYEGGEAKFTNEVLTTSLSGTKEWVDDDATTRPAKITIHLLANGKPTDKYVELASTETEWSFTDLPVNDENGAITYAVSEDEVPGYVSEIVDTTITNTKIADGQAVVQAKKVLTGDATLTEGQFTFVLKDASGAVVDTKTNGADGTVTFGALTYTEAKDYTYTIEEVLPEGATAENNYTVDGMTYDPAKHPVTVKVEQDDATKALVATVTYGEGSAEAPVFTNSYNVKETTLELSLSKTLTNGSKLQAGRTETFTFILADANGVTKDEATVSFTNASVQTQTVSFDALTFDTEGTFNYTISEIPATANDIISDIRVYFLEVKVDDVNGQLVATKTLTSQTSPDDNAAATEIAFVNTYDIDKLGELTLNVEKAMIGRNFQDGDSFTFTLTGSAGAPMPETTTVTITPTSGTTAAVDFGKISYTEADVGKTYTYTVQETAGTLPGVTYDTTAYEVAVEIAEGEDALIVTPTYAEGEKVIITNTYDIDKLGELTLNVEKAMVGREFQSGDSFTFTLTGSEGAPMPETTTVTITPTSGTTAAVDFGKISYTEADVGKTYYTYTVQETAGTLPGVTYDTTAYEVAVEIAEGEDALIVTPTYAEGEKVIITNSYEVVLTEIKVTKEWVETNPEQEALRPATVAVQLYADDVPVTNGKLLLSRANQWTVTFMYLEKYRADGTPIVYTVKEVTEGATWMAYYTPGDPAGDMANGYTITNTSKHVATTEVAVTKAWVEANAEQQALRPASIEVQLYADNVATDKVLTLTATNDWTGKFTDLVKYQSDNVTPIVYTVKEVTEDADWTAYYKPGDPVGDMANGFTITNTSKHVATTEIAVTKAWVETNAEQQALRPASIEVRLYADNVATDKVLTLTATNDWTGNFTDLVKYQSDNVTPIVYTVKEVTEDADWTANYTPGDPAGDMANGFTITNTCTYDATGKLLLTGSKEVTGDSTVDQHTFCFGVYDQTGKEVAAGTNDATGKITFSEIAYTLDQAGTHLYTVKEMVTEDAVDTDVYDVTFDATVYEILVNVTNNITTGNLDVTWSINKPAEATGLAFTNEVKLRVGSIGVLKVDSKDTTKGLSGAEFTVYTNKECTEILMLNGTKAVITTGATGAGSLTGLPIGTYWVKETKAPQHYLLDEETIYEVTVVEDDTAMVNGIHVTNKQMAKLALEKSDRLNPDKKLPGAEYTLFTDEECEDILVLPDGTEAIITTGEDGVGELEGVPAGTYWVKETKAPTGYEVDPEPYKVTVEEDADPDEPVFVQVSDFPLRGALALSKTVVANSEVTDTFLFDIELTLETDDPIAGSYEATLNGAAADKVTFAATETGAKATVELKDGDTLTIFGLRSGVSYTVTEQANSRYEVEVNGVKAVTAQGTISDVALSIVKYQNTLKETGFTVEKVWLGEDAGEIQLTLYANGVAMDPQPAVTRQGNTYTYADLVLNDENGKEIVYTVKETAMAGYTTTYENKAPYADKTDAAYNGGKIINQAMTIFAVKKEWSGLAEGEKAPAIQLTLYCNGTVYTAATPAPDKDGWYTYTDLPAYVDGKLAVYTVKEQPVTGFTTTYLNKGENAAVTDCAYNGSTIVNSKIPQTGDGTPLALWMLTTLLAACGLMGVMAALRKREN